MAVDPWAKFAHNPPGGPRTDFSGGEGTYDNPRRRCGTKGVTTTYRKTTMDRARKRLDDISETGNLNEFMVEGNESLNDSSSVYFVRRHVHPVVDGKVDWHCSCYDTTHGEDRARRGCTHVLAVQIWLEESSQEDGRTGQEGDSYGHDASRSRDVRPVHPTEHASGGGGTDAGDGSQGPGRVLDEGGHGDASGGVSGRDDRPGDDDGRAGGVGGLRGQPADRRGADGAGEAGGGRGGGVDDAWDQLVGCEDCGWIGDDADLANHYLNNHVEPSTGHHDSLDKHDLSESVVQVGLHPSDPLLGSPGLPDWVTGFRPHQIQAIEEVLELYRSGLEVVFLDAPTGSGKTLIGEVVRRLVGRVGGTSDKAGRGLYVCSGKSLQDQFLRDYDYASVLKGRSNYPTSTAPFPDITCGDCNKTPGENDCDWCDEAWACPYQHAKVSALRSSIAVVNTSYLLAEANHVGAIADGRDLMIVDECDMLEKELMGYVTFEVRARTLESLGVPAPKKGVHKKTISMWLMDELLPAAQGELRRLRGRTDDVRKLRRKAAMQKLAGQIPGVADQIMDDNWVRDNTYDGALVLKPVKVDEFGDANIWSHGGRWLLMSATIVSADEMADSLGLGDRSYDVVQIPMTFAKENRAIRVWGAANMTYKEKDTAWPKMLEAIRRILTSEEHRGQRALVHSVSYDLTKYLTEGLRRAGLTAMSYASSQDREAVIARYRATPGAVLVAPSLDRGVDFKGDDCRVVIVAKVPYPSLGDKQVSQRVYGPGGQQWYNVQTIRSLVQMTGRGVRSEDDFATSYILDAQFKKNLWKSRRLFPEWWAEGLDDRWDGRWLTR